MTSTSPNSDLPAGFETLEPFLQRWALPTTVARMRARELASMAEIQALYDALTPCLPAALAYLQGVPYDGNMALVDRNLLGLCLAVAEIAPAVEWYGQPQVIDGYAGSVLTLTSELP
jgi:hypothetical protein